jgi:hypothetical protein
MNAQEAEAALEITRELMFVLGNFKATEDWHRKVLETYTKLAQATGIVPRDSDPYGPLDFVAKILYAHDCASSGKEPIKWAFLQVDLKERFREQAIHTVGSWANEELQHERLLGMKTGKLTE